MSKGKCDNGRVTPGIWIGGKRASRSSEDDEGWGLKSNGTVTYQQLHWDVW